MPIKPSHLINMGRWDITSYGQGIPQNIINSTIQSAMNRNPYSTDCTVPSLSLSSSRSKRTIPTKDIADLPAQHEFRPRIETIDRINRPPLQNAKNIRDSSFVRQELSTSYKEIRTGGTVLGVPPTRNAYLAQEEMSGKKDKLPTFRQEEPRSVYEPVRSAHTLAKSPSFSLLRNPESHAQVGQQMERTLQNRKIDVNKSLFDRKIKKLLQQAEFYDNELKEMYPDNSQALAQQLSTLEQYRNEALQFNFLSSVPI